VETCVNDVPLHFFSVGKRSHTFFLHEDVRSKRLH